MTKRLIKVLAINPGAIYLAIAAFNGYELNDWRIKHINIVKSKEKQKRLKSILCGLMEEYEPDVLAVKRVHPSRSSTNLDKLVNSIKQLAKSNGLKIYQYSLQDIEKFFSTGVRISKRELAEIIVYAYPALWHEFDKERNNKVPYYFRVFEAVGLGAMCAHKLETNNRG